MRKLSILVICTAMCALLPSCFLLPAEEELPRLPLVTEYVGREVNYAEVYRGNLELSQKLTVRFLPSAKEELKFDVSGIPIAAIYYAQGQTVNKGDLIAELSDDALHGDITETEQRLAELETDYAYYTENIEIASNSDALYFKEQNYRLERTRAEDEMYVLKLKLDELYAKRESIRLYAGIDGVVTYVTANRNSSRGTTVAVITETRSGFLYADTPYADRFTPGMEIEILMNSVYHTAVAASPEDAGAEAFEDRAYFILTGSGAENMREGTGELKLIIDSRENVLILPARAVITAGDEHAVYIRDNGGTLSLKTVRAGLETPDGIEIIDGLEEGERVVIG